MMHYEYLHDLSKYLSIYMYGLQAPNMGYFLDAFGYQANIFLTLGNCARNIFEILKIIIIDKL